ncbi:MAG: FAD-dependent thymidylate synthase [Peptoniphilus lacydonensis]|uniref:FAD-dependent thymidylate synthase n=1 Tax=Peptoniphilus lacydonensis TaxID=1673725 RepID=UPI002900E9EE|nr:FAD-dependent thymidylate synthase [Peptoniphilus lacydonensis]MDU2116014.1 FAD-dependent thymidylate synthase [Peptoniphilus lacydonensis]
MFDEELFLQIANEMVRHRLASYSQQSSRYVDLSDLKVILPLDIKYHDVGYEMSELFEECEKVYRKLVENGVKRDVARSVLPLATETEIIMTMNFRSLRHFLKLRLHKSAHANIRDIARKIYDIVDEKYPVFVEDLEDLV